MPWQPAPIVGGAYSDDTRPFARNDTVNYLPVRAEIPDARSGDMLRGAPGFILRATLGTGAIRGHRNVEGRMFVVAGNALYLVNSDWSSENLGYISGSGRCVLSHNQITNGQQLAIATGQNMYLYNTVTSTLSQVTDEGFLGALTVDYLDSYFLAVEPGRRFAAYSSLADGASWNTLDRFEGEGAPDKIVGAIVDHREYWLFGERSAEIFLNTGGASSAFERASNTFIERGCAATHSIAKMDNTIFWLGDDRNIYRANGVNPERISDHALEQEISRYPASVIRNAFAFTYEDRGHKVYYITFPGRKTFGYDVSQGLWHRRESFGLDRWRLSTLIKWNGKWIGGDYANGNLYELDWDTYTEAGQPLVARRRTGFLHNNANRLMVDGVRLKVAPGVGLPSLSGWVPLPISGVPYELVSEGAAFVGNYLEADASDECDWTLAITSAAELPVRVTWESYNVPNGGDGNQYAPASLELNAVNLATNEAAPYPGNWSTDDVTEWTPEVPEFEMETGDELAYIQSLSTGDSVPNDETWSALIEVYLTVEVQDRVISMRFSNDGGNNWSNWHQRSLGEQGEFNIQPTWRRLGSCFDRVFEFEISSPVKRDILAAYLWA